MQSKSMAHMMTMVTMVTTLCISVVCMGSAKIVSAQAPSPNATGLIASATASGDHLVYLPIATNGKAAVKVTLDASRAVTTTIGEQGGELRALAADGTAYVFTVPPGALDFDEVITMTPAASIQNFPLSGGVAGAVSLEPAGLFFYTSTLLRITPTVALTGPLNLGFAFDGSGHFHLRPLATRPASVNVMPEAMGSELIQEIRLLRGYGVGSGTESEVVQQHAQSTPTSPSDALDADFVIEPLVSSALSTFYEATRAKLKSAESNAQLAESATQDFAKLLDAIATKGNWDEWSPAIKTVRASLVKVLRHAADTAIARCFSQKRPEEAFAVLRWARFSEALLPPDDTTAATIKALIGKCLKFKVTFHSEVKQTAGASGFGTLLTVEAVATLKANSNGLMLAVSSAPLDYVSTAFVNPPKDTCPLSFETTGSTWDAQRANFGLQIVPVSRMSPAVNISLRYMPGQTSETLVIACPGLTQRLPAPRWYSGFLHLHEYEWEGSVTSIRTVTSGIVNVGTFTGWVYHNDSQESGTVTVENSRIDLEHTPEQ